MLRISHRQQRTIAGPAQVQGVGFVTGKTIRLRFRPAPINTGIVFHRIDLGPQALLPARIDQVTGTARRTTLGKAPLNVSLVEHVLAALAGMHVDNCIVELDGPEPPGLDGSARSFVQALNEAGFVLQNARRDVLGVTKTVLVRSNDATLAIHPPVGSELRISYFLDYGRSSPIVRQVHTQSITPAGFAQELASCRTFLLEEEAHALLAQGLGSQTTITDLVVFGPHGPIDNSLRFGNEPARHKILDIVGDLSLAGFDLCGHVVAYRSGHPLNIELARLLAQAQPMVMQRPVTLAA